MAKSLAVNIGMVTLLTGFPCNNAISNMVDSVLSERILIQFDKNQVVPVAFTCTGSYGRSRLNCTFAGTRDILPSGVYCFPGYTAFRGILSSGNSTAKLAKFPRKCCCPLKFRC